MSNRKTEAAAAHVEDALASALADVLGLDEQDVEVRVDAPGIADRPGRWHVAVSYEDGDASESTGDASGEAGPAASFTDGADDPHAARTGASDDTVSAAAATSDGQVADDEAADDADDVVPDDAGTRAAAAQPGEDVVDDAEVPAAPDEGSHDDERDDENGDDDEDGDDAVLDLEEEAEAAADFVEGLLDALDLPGDLRITYGEDHAEVEVVDVGSGALIGRRGQTLEAIQELLRCSLQREFQRRARVKIDVEGYRSRRLEKLLEKADEAIDAVLDTGTAERLEPMDVFERKAIHHRVAKVDGLSSRSQGREPARRVIIERD